MSILLTCFGIKKHYEQEVKVIDIDDLEDVDLTLTPDLLSVHIDEPKNENKKEQVLDDDEITEMVNSIETSTDYDFYTPIPKGLKNLKFF